MNSRGAVAFDARVVHAAAWNGLLAKGDDEKTDDNIDSE